MSELPKGWVEAKLENIASDINYGYTASSTSEEIGPRLLRITDIQNDRVNWSKVPFCAISEDKIDQYRLASGDLVFARTGATVGKSYLIRDDVLDAVYASYLIRVRCSASNSIEFLAYFFKSQNYWAQITEFSAGVGQPNVNGTKLKSLVIPLPPLNEQIRIANKLDRLLAKVDAAQSHLEKIPTLLKRFRQAVLAAATSGELSREFRANKQLPHASTLLESVATTRNSKLTTEINEGKSEAQRILKKAKEHNPKLPDQELPANWVWTSFMEAMERVVDCHNKTAPYIEEGIPLIRTPDIRDGKISLEGAKFISQETYDFWSRRCPPKPGDIIFTREAPMGEAGIIPEGVMLCMGQRMMLLRPIPAFVMPDYVLLNILSLDFKSRMEQQAIGTGVKHLRVADVENLSFPLPPLEEQKEIVRRVDTLFALAAAVEKQYTEAKQRLDRLSLSLLAKAFRGELVPQDPNDEPASELLKRIQAERAGNALGKKGRKVKSETSGHPHQSALALDSGSSPE